MVDRVSNEAGPDRAEALVLSIFSALERIAGMPEMGHRREDLTDEDLRFWPVFSYLIVYRPGGTPLEVVRVLHGHQDVEARLKGG